MSRNRETYTLPNGRTTKDRKTAHQAGAFRLNVRTPNPFRSPASTAKTKDGAR